MIEAWDACQEVLHAYIVRVGMYMQLREEQAFLCRKLVVCMHSCGLTPVKACSLATWCRARVLAYETLEA